LEKTLAQGNSNESVSVSFHFLQKELPRENDLPEIHPFTQHEFDALAEKIKTMPVPNLKDGNDFDGVKSGRLIHVEAFERRDERCFFALHHSAYWGHSFQNSDKGKIEAQSLNMRPFQFLMYLSDDGKIYIGCQYLGNYGSYGEISRSIMKLLGLGRKVRAHSFRLDGEDFKNATPTEVKIDLYAKSKKIDDKNTLGSGSMVAFKKTANDDTFELSVRDKLLALIGMPMADIKKAIAKLLNENELFSVADDDILDCKVVVRKKKGGTKTVYLFEDGQFATKFHLEVDLNGDGHPLQDKARSVMYKKLADEIIQQAAHG
jgi:hypothetical protein